MDAAPHLLAEPFEIGGGGVAGVDQEIGVLFRHHGAAALQSAATGTIDQLPGAMAGRIGEGRSARARADGLTGFARRLYLGHALLDHDRVARRADETRLHEDPFLRYGAVPIDEAERGRWHDMAVAG